MSSSRSWPFALLLVLAACSSSPDGLGDDAAIEGDAAPGDSYAPGSDAAKSDTGPASDGGADTATRTDTASGTDTASATDTAIGTDTKTPLDTAVVDTAPPDGGSTCVYTKDSDGFFKLASPKSDYWVRLPPGYEADPKPQTLLFGMHGCGDTARNFATWAIVPYALRATQSYIAVSLGGREGACWSIGSDVATAQAALAHVQSCFNVNPKKIVLAGYSSGGGMAFSMGLKGAASYAGILIENSGLSQAVGAGNVSTVLSSAAWKINIAQSARIGDGSYPIAGIRSDRDKMIAAGFPLQYRDLDGGHDGTSDDWSGFLIPKIAAWTAP
jgi:predicted esterase